MCLKKRQIFHHAVLFVWVDLIPRVLSEDPGNEVVSEFYGHTMLIAWFIPTCDLSFQVLFKDKSHFFKDLFFIQFNCIACASRFLITISARSRPYLRHQLCGHTIDTMLFACPLSMHSSSLCIKGHVPTSYCISTGPSALLTSWHRKRWLTRGVTTVARPSRNCREYRLSQYLISGRHSSYGTSSNSNELDQ